MADHDARGGAARVSSESENSRDFAFEDAILQLDPSRENEQRGKDNRRLSLFDGASALTALALTVGLQIVCGAC